MLKAFAYVESDVDQRELAKAFPLPHSAPSCGDCTRDDNRTESRYVCSRSKGHRGLHVAHSTPTRVCAVWDGQNNIIGREL